MTEPLLKRTLSRFRTRTKTGLRPRDVPPDASSTSSHHAHLSLPCTNQSTVPAHSSHTAPEHKAQDPGSDPVCVLRSCSSPGSSPSPVSRGPGPGPGPGPGQVSPGLRSYLQSLDSSSRAWLLSSGKAPPPDQAPPTVVPVGEGLIWYNPIPEEEEGPERGGVGSEDKTEAKVDSASGGVSERVMDRLRSPALKLRRKLSLKSRRDRQGNSSQETPPSSQDPPPKDSSSPSRKRPIRRQHSGRRGHHGDDEEQSPWQQVTSPQGDEPRLHSSAHNPTQSLTGVLTVHLQKVNLPTHRSGVSRCVSVVIQVDDVIRARTAAMTMTSPALRLDHAFHLQLERAQNLKVLVLSRVSPDPEVKTCSRTRLCAVGGASLPTVFRGSLHLSLSPSLSPSPSLSLSLFLCQAGEETGGGAQVFGVELRVVVQRESSEKPVPLIIQNTVSEINRRGLKVQGVYRLCGSSSLKKQLRDNFESNSSSVKLRECSDLHAITGVLKDYLRELPSPLITPSLYEAVKEVMTSDPCVTPKPVQLLQCLPPVHRATLSFLMDHLALVSSLSLFNKMTAQNLAVCFGPVLFVQTDQSERSTVVTGQSGHSVDFKQHIEALHFLLRHWPVPPLHLPQEEEGGATKSSPEAVGGASPEHRCRGRDLRHRQAGDWSRYQQRAPAPVDEESVLDFKNPVLDFDDPVLDFDAPFNCRLSLKDFDLLIQDFHRQLNRV
ncbi:rho GTPase-activating protein SYDE1-like [Eucyclogobius newberryi]|uniref:rho GTPase-activating protein SYDE1-like n=1 Tax=Eucyclogobius newberryi TaxID=166745 RepID=UPI003B5A3845